MTRIDFLKSLGLGGMALLAVLTSCKHDDVVAYGSTAPAGPVDFTLDLALSINAALRNNGGYVVSNGVVVARTMQGVYVAATRTCSHAQQQAIVFEGNKFVCSLHGAQFDQNGKGLNALGSSGIEVFSVERKGNQLWVHS